jgi:hypothetical protein
MSLRSIFAAKGGCDVRKRAQLIFLSLNWTPRASLGTRPLGEMLTESLQRQPENARSVMNTVERGL